MQIHIDCSDTFCENYHQLTKKKHFFLEAELKIFLLCSFFSEFQLLIFYPGLTKRYFIIYQQIISKSTETLSHFLILFCSISPKTMICILLSSPLILSFYHSTHVFFHSKRLLSFLI